MLFILLILLIMLSGFFSSSETGLMAINRYRLQHLVKKNHPAAKRVSDLLTRPDRMLSVILIGNTFANILASAVVTMLAVRHFGEKGIFIATLILTLVILIFAEIIPKTLAALYPQPVAFFVSLPLRYLLKLWSPLVWVSSGLGMAFLRLVGVQAGKQTVEPFTRHELQAILQGMGSKIALAQQAMLLNILDLDELIVHDIMIPMDHIKTVDFSQPWPSLIKCLLAMPCSQVLVYKHTMDHVLGFLKLAEFWQLALHQSSPTREAVEALLEPVHYIPKVARVSMQLFNFQKQNYRIGLVVDGYGEIMGFIRLVDILEEIVGHFETDLTDLRRAILPEIDGNYRIRGTIPIRDLNRVMGWNLPTKGSSNTLSGLIIEYLETIPSRLMGLRINNYPMDILEIKDNQVTQVRVYPQLATLPKLIHDK